MNFGENESSHLILLAPWLLADFHNKPRNLRSNSSRLWVLFGVLLGLVVPIFGGRPVLVLVLSQALTIIASPVVLILMYILLNDNKLMGKYKSNPSFLQSKRYYMSYLNPSALFFLKNNIFGIIGIN